MTDLIFDILMAFILLGIMLYEPQMIPYCIVAYIISRSARKIFGRQTMIEIIEVILLGLNLIVAALWLSCWDAMREKDDDDA